MLSGRLLRADGGTNPHALKDGRSLAGSSSLSIDALTTQAIPAARYYVHPSACVDEPCQIGDGTAIWHISHVMRDAVIGRNCRIGQNVFIASGVRIGDNV